MITLRMKKARIGCAITTNNLKTDKAAQAESIRSIASVAPRTIVVGLEKPEDLPGLRYVRGDEKYSLKNAIGSYMQEFRGYEIIVLCNPDVEFTDKVPDLLKFVDAQKVDMSWGCYVGAGNAPFMFIVSSHVLAHILNDIPDGLLFTSDWQTWLHTWMKRMLNHRYFDANPYDIANQVKPVTKQEQPAQKGAIGRIADQLGSIISGSESRANKELANSQKSGKRY